MNWLTDLVLPTARAEIEEAQDLWPIVAGVSKSSDRIAMITPPAFSNFEEKQFILTYAFQLARYLGGPEIICVLDSYFKPFPLDTKAEELPLTLRNDPDAQDCLMVYRSISGTLDMFMAYPYVKRKHEVTWSEEIDLSEMEQNELWFVPTLNSISAYLPEVSLGPSLFETCRNLGFGVEILEVAPNPLLN